MTEGTTPDTEGARDRTAPSTPDSAGASGLIDLARYPIHAPEEAAAKALVARCRARLDDGGAVVLEHFLKAEAVAAALSEIAPMLGRAYYCAKRHNPYLDAGDDSLPADHPRNRPQVSDVGCLADDQIPEGSVLRRIYRWAPMHDFIAALIGVARLYPCADPLGSLNLNVFRPGQQLGWHFDNADFAVTLMLQPAEAGGVYEYSPWTRTPEDQRHDVVAGILDVDRRGLARLSMDVGALVLFRGRYSLHRVSVVEGRRPRLVAVLSYDTEPGVMLSEHNRRLFYGRIA